MPIIIGHIFEYLRSVLFPLHIFVVVSHCASRCFLLRERIFGSWFFLGGNIAAIDRTTDIFKEFYVYGGETAMRQAH